MSERTDRLQNRPSTPDHKDVAGLVNYAKRYHAGERVGTSITKGTANFLVNRRMNKSQQMRWSRRGADLLLQVRCAVYNGTLGSGFGQKFQPANDPSPSIPVAAWPPILRQSHSCWISARSNISVVTAEYRCRSSSRREKAASTMSSAAVVNRSWSGSAL
ncbi:MAG: hypothetical protein JO118_05905 [Acetobacteraceae bacterium]|nr:hypothetical protein [Acetobacteraceae bacterium]MBV8737744.1 hypothetical protein [Alphaproteobacteria bacterium]